MKDGLTLEEQSLQFERTAMLYDKYCTSYPTELIEAIISKSGILPEDEILEIGSGSGEATQFFARDYRMTCIEPGDKLVSLCKKKLGDSKEISYHIDRFETWDNKGKKFKLIIAGQSLHWVPMEIRYLKISESLQDDGYVGLFWNMYLNDEAELSNDLSQLCKEYNLLIFKTETQIYNQVNAFNDEILNSKQFKDSKAYIFPWQTKHTLDTFLGFLNTGLGYQNLTSEDRHLFDTQLKILFKRSNNILNLKINCVLYLAKKAKLWANN